MSTPVKSPAGSVRKSMALALATALSLAAAAPAMANNVIVPGGGDGGPAYAQMGFSKTQMRHYAEARLLVEQGATVEEATAQVNQMDPGIYNRIDRAAKNDLAIEVSAKHFMNQLAARQK